MTDPSAEVGWKGFRDRRAHERAHELWDLPDWHPDAPSPGMRHMLRRALQRCLTEPGWCDYQNRADTSDLQADQLR